MKRIFVFLIVVLLISVGTASSVQRIISSSSDNVYTMIRNSNGNIWEAIPDNIQVAINDLGNNSGVVWLPGGKTFYITDTIILWKNVCLDMQGAEIRLPNGTDCTVVDMRDGSEIRNGVIDTSGHQRGTYKTNTTWSTTTHRAMILLNASNCIDSVTIDRMFLETSSRNNASDIWTLNTYNDNRDGRGYGVYLHALDIDAPQWIRNVAVRRSQFKCFHIGIYIHNERNNGTNTSHIDNNIFENLWMNACHTQINISRNTGASRANCSTANNSFNIIHTQAGRSSSIGGEQITYHNLIVEGYGNAFRNVMLWDLGDLYGDRVSIWMKPDAKCMYIQGRGVAYSFDNVQFRYNGNWYFRVNGTLYTIINSGTYGDLVIHRIMENPSALPPPPPPPVPPTDWNISNWSYYKVITINSSYVDENHTNFPILVSNTSGDFNLTNGKVQGDGDDFVFVTSDNITQYNHEIEKFDNSTGELVAWVNITLLNSTSDTIVHLFYGNSNCGNMQNMIGTWNNDYFGVWHMRNDSGYVIDSTNQSDGSIDGTLHYSTDPKDNFICNESGKIGYSFDLWNYDDGSDCVYVELNDIDTTLNNDTFSVLVWARTRNLGTSNSSNYKTIMAFADGSSSVERFKLTQTKESDAAFGDLLVDSAGSYGMTMDGGWDDNWWMDKNNTWRFFYTTFNFTGSLARCYFNTTDYWEDTDGLEQNSSELKYLRFGGFTTGAAAPEGYCFNGSIDEIRILNVAKNQNWVNTTYNTMNSPETFLAVGDEQSV